MKELHDFASEEQVNWEEDFEEQRREWKELACNRLVLT